MNTVATAIIITGLLALSMIGIAYAGEVKILAADFQYRDLEVPVQSKRYPRVLGRRQVYVIHLLRKSGGRGALARGLRRV